MGDEDADDEYIDTRELARWLKVDERTPEGWRARGVGPSYVRLEGGGVRYSRRDARAWIKARTVHSSKLEYDDNGNISARKKGGSCGG